MKKLIIAVCLLGGTSAARAWEVKNNPDRFPSVGIHTGLEHLGGDYSNTLNPATKAEIVQPQSEAVNTSFVGFDARFPMFSQVTVTFSYDKIRRDLEIVREGNTFQSHEGVSGDRFDMGMRFYFTK